MWAPDAGHGSLGTDGVYLLHKGLFALLWDAGLVLLTKYSPTTYSPTTSWPLHLCRLLSFGPSSPFAVLEIWSLY